MSVDRSEEREWKQRERGRRSITRIGLALSGTFLALLMSALFSTTSAEAATVVIYEPPSGAVLPSETVNIQINTSAFTLSPATSGSPPGGHYEVLLDGVRKKLDWHLSTWLACVPEGPHVLTVRLLDYSGNPVGVEMSTNMIVAAGAPGLCFDTALGPSPGNGNGACNFALNVSFDNVNPTDPVTNPSGVHYDLDVADISPPPYMQNPGQTHLSKWSGQAHIAGLTTSHTYRIHIGLALNTGPTHPAFQPSTWDEYNVTIVSSQPPPPAPPVGCWGIKLAFQNPAQSTGVVTGFDPYYSYTPSVSIGVEVTNFTLDAAAIGGDNVEGRGHYLAWLDGVLIANRTDVSIGLTGLAEGYHILVVELVNNDGTSFPLRVMTGIDWSVIGHSPKLTVQTPSGGASVPPGTVEIEVGAEDFTIDGPALGGHPEPWRGHYHVYLDGVMKGEGTGSTFSLVGVTEGTHTISVEPVNNDHSAIVGAIGDTVSITVAPPPPPPLPWELILFVIIVVAEAVIFWVILARRRAPAAPPPP